MNKIKILGIIYTFIIVILLGGLPLYFGGKLVLNTFLEAETVHYEAFGDNSEDELILLNNQPFIYKAIDFYMDLFTGCCLFFSIREGIKIRRQQKGKDYYGNTQKAMTGTFMTASIIFLSYYFMNLPDFRLFLGISSLVVGAMIYCYLVVISSLGDNVLKRIFSWH